LFRFDDDLATDPREGGCVWCGGRLHRANYPRKPRGSPAVLGPDYDRRFDFCCDRDALPRAPRPARRRLRPRVVQAAPPPHKDWASNEPDRLVKVLADLARTQKDFGKRVSLADLSVLGGCAAVEEAAKKAGHAVTVPFAPGRTDASQAQTDVEASEVLEPAGDGFRNCVGEGDPLTPETRLLDRANILSLTAPEMTVLLGGLRALDANHGHSKHGVLTARPGTLTNDFFVNLLDEGTAWRPSGSAKGVYEGSGRATGSVRWTPTAADLVFGAHSQLRALAEAYASDDAREKFVRDFVSAWSKVMNLDRYDLLAAGGKLTPPA
jgi:catalase-peroxidase